MSNCSLFNWHLLAKVDVLFSNKFFRNKHRLVVDVSLHGILEDSLPVEIGCLKSLEGYGKCRISMLGRSHEEYWLVVGQIERNCFLSPLPILHTHALNSTSMFARLLPPAPSAMATEDPASIEVSKGCWVL